VIEKMQTPTREQWQKKIMPYLDGSLSADEHNEFEAYVRTHPDFEKVLKLRMSELSLLRSLIPVPALSAESKETLEYEMRASINNLLKEEPKNAWDQMKSSFEEWFNR